jgi:hypothetical protein
MNRPESISEKSVLISQRQLEQFPHLLADRSFLRDPYLAKLDAIKYEILGLQIDGCKPDDPRLKELNDQSISLNLKLEDIDAIPGSNSAIFQLVPAETELSEINLINPLTLKEIYPKLKELCSLRFKQAIKQLDIEELQYNKYDQLCLIFASLTIQNTDNSTQDMDITIIYDSDLNAYFVTQNSEQRVLDVIGVIS